MEGVCRGIKSLRSRQSAGLEDEADMLLRFLACACLIPIPLSAEMAMRVQPPPREEHPGLFVSGQVRAAGMIFSGRVLSISRSIPPDSTGTVQITFRVESAIRGTRSGQIVRVREWSGLWSGGERYRVGERLVLCLYPASRIGLTSPVGGTAGRYEIDKSGRVMVRDGSSSRPIKVRKFVSELRRAVQEK